MTTATSKQTATANAVLDAAELVTGEGNWHGKKVFISALYDAMDCAAQGVDFAEFGAMLVELHQARLLRLSRADLVEAMPRALVFRSEVAHLNATFHFVRIDG